MHCRKCRCVYQIMLKMYKQTELKTVCKCRGRVGEGEINPWSKIYRVKVSRSNRLSPESGKKYIPTTDPSPAPIFPMLASNERNQFVTPGFKWLHIKVKILNWKLPSMELYFISPCRLLPYLWLLPRTEWCFTSTKHLPVLHK